MQHLCPNCGEDLEDRDEAEFECPECGYNACWGLVVAGYLSLDALNDLRQENDLEPLTTLPKRDKSLIKNPKPDEKKTWHFIED